MQSNAFKFFLFTTLLILMASSTNPSLEEVMNYISTIVNEKSEIRDIKVWGGSLFYDHNLKPSVIKYLFEDVSISENIAPKGNINRPGDTHEKVYICVHDIGSSNYGVKEWSDIVYHNAIGNRSYEASY